MVRHLFPFSFEKSKVKVSPSKWDQKREESKGLFFFRTLGVVRPISALLLPLSYEKEASSLKSQSYSNFKRESPRSAPAPQRSKNWKKWSSWTLRKLVPSQTHIVFFLQKGEGQGNHKNYRIAKWDGIEIAKVFHSSCSKARIHPCQLLELTLFHNIHEKKNNSRTRNPRSKKLRDRFICACVII